MLAWAFDVTLSPQLPACMQATCRCCICISTAASCRWIASSASQNLLISLVNGLIAQVNAVIVECACVIELPDLKGVAKLKDVPLYIQVQKEGD